MRLGTPEHSGLHGNGVIVGNARWRLFVNQSQGSRTLAQ